MIAPFFFLLCAASRSIAQQPKDSVPEYMKKFRYINMPGMPDSATFSRKVDSGLRMVRIDSLMKKYDSLAHRLDSLRRLLPPPPTGTVAYNRK